MAKCRVTSKNKLFTFEEQRSKLTLQNKDEVESTKIHVDGCEITTGIKCDYLHLAKNIEMYIELKGQDINHAINQIKSTIAVLSANPKTQKKRCYIICTRVTKADATRQNVKLKFKRDYNADLIIMSSPYEDSY